MLKLFPFGAILFFLLVGCWLKVTFGTFLTFLWGLFGVWFLGSLIFVGALLHRLKILGAVSLQTLRRRIKHAVVAFLCGANGFFVSAILIGRSTCDCCEREHPNAVRTYPLLDSNLTVSKIMNNSKTLAILASSMMILNFVSLGLTGLSILYGTVYADAFVWVVLEKLKKLF